MQYENVSSELVCAFLFLCRKLEKKNEITAGNYLNQIEKYRLDTLTFSP